jgi:glycosyltransferase involved in cell wall biosynthesis
VRVVLTSLYFFPDRPGGHEQLAWDHAVGLSREGHEAFLVAEAGDRPCEERVVVDGVRVLRYVNPRRGGLDPRRAVSHQRAVDALLARHVEGCVDAVVGHTLFSYLAALRRFGPGAISTYCVHSPVRSEYAVAALGNSALERARLAVAGRLLNRVERRALTASTTVIALSSFTRSLLERNHGETIARRIRVVPGWVDGARFAPVEDVPAVRRVLGLPDDGPVLFTLRRLVPRMGLENLIEACARLRTSGASFSLFIGGEGPLRPALETRVRVAGLSDRISFLGRIPEETLPRWYAAADAFLLPTAELECFGLVALEAMASGRPVLATPVGAIPEIVGRYEKEWLSRDASVKELQDLVGRFLGGSLPRWDPHRLHSAVVRDFGREAVLPRLIALSLGRPEAG